MSACESLTKRRVFYILAVVVALSLTIVAIRDLSWFRETLPVVTRITSVVVSSASAITTDGKVLTTNGTVPLSDVTVPPTDRTDPPADGSVLLTNGAVPSTVPEISAASARRDFTETPGSSDQLETWRRTNLRALSKEQLEKMYFNILEQQQIQCPSSTRIGQDLDGGWDVCFADPFDILKSQPCVAFSFGINNIWDYDDQLADKYRCMVYMFDPSMTGVTDHQRRNTSWFYLTGLASENKLASNGWKMRTLCQLFKDMGYLEKPIDILKVDIEFWEWDSFEQAMKDGCLKQVKQLLFETHTAEFQGKASDHARFIRVWRGLFELGFRTWKWHRNPMSVFYVSAGGVQRACCYEHYMLNTKLL